MDNWPNAPFKQTVEPEAYKDNIQRHGDVVVRFVREFATHNHEVDSLDGEPVMQGSLPEGPSHAHVEGLSRLRGLYAELSEEYGIEHSGFYPVVGRADDKIGEFVVSKWIKGEPTVDPAVSKIPDSQVPAAKLLFAKLTHYVRSKHASREEMLSDIFGYQQYVYVPERDLLVLVDVDPYAEHEFGTDHAYKRISTWASQILEGEELDKWHADMQKMINESTRIRFDEDF